MKKLSGDIMTTSVRFVADFQDGHVIDVALFIEDEDEPMTLYEYENGSPTRRLFDAAWDYFIGLAE